MTRRYAILDVFTATPLAGNPLAVVLEGQGLDAARMQAVAREFNLSETVFVIEPDNPVHSARLRLFTPQSELPFAGHPTVGTAVLLALRKAENPDLPEAMLVLEEGLGPVRCGVSVKDAVSGHAIFDAPRLPIRMGGLADRETIAAALGLMPLELGFENHEPSAFSAGLPVTFVPVRDLDALAKAKPDLSVWPTAFTNGAPAAFLYFRDADHHFRARFFAPTLGVGEDPATGSAVAALAGVLRRFDDPPAGTHNYVIEQGVEMGRPSLIELEMDMEGDEVVSVRIGGEAIVVAEGALTID